MSTWLPGLYAIASANPALSTFIIIIFFFASDTIVHLDRSYVHSMILFYLVLVLLEQEPGNFFSATSVAWARAWEHHLLHDHDNEALTLRVWPIRPQSGFNDFDYIFNHIQGKMKNIWLFSSEILKKNE